MERVSILTATIALALLLVGLMWKPARLEQPAVFVIGNSVARGCCVALEERWPRAVGTALAAHPLVIARDGASTTDIVEAKRHWANGQQRTQLERAVASLERTREVRAVVLAAGINDIFFLHDPAIGESCLWADTITCRVHVGRATDTIRTNLDRMMEELMATKPPDAPLVLLTYVVEDCDIALNRLIREAAERHDALLVDACRALAGELESVLSEDGLHLSATGQAALAGLILDAIASD